MQQAPSPGRPRPRIETLADLIFGLSLSIGAIALIAESPTTPGQILGHMAAFAFTFLILITAWIIYTTDMSVLPTEKQSITFLNVALLLLVALVPYLLNNVELVNQALPPEDAAALRDFSSSLFALDLAGILFILAAFAHIISREEKRLVEPVLAARFRSGRNRMAILATVMIVSVAPIFWQVMWYGVPVRIYLWYLPMVSYWLGRVVRPQSRTYLVGEGAED